MTTSRTRHSDEGFTLPELLITVVILGVIMVSIGAAFMTAIRTQEQPATKLGPSNDANLLASYFTADVQSASVSNTTATAPSGCNAAMPADTTNVIALAWTDNAPTPAQSWVAAYQWHAPSLTLRRVSCLAGQVPTVAVLARNITAASAVVNSTVGSVRLDISALDPAAPVGELPFTFSLRAHGRLAGNDSGGGSGPASGANQLPLGEILGTVTRYTDQAGTVGGVVVAGLPMSLSQGATVVATRLTGTDGKYYFGSLADGTYTLALVAPVAGGLAPTTGEPISRTVTVLNGVATGTPDLSFGLWLPLGSVSGKVRLDNVAQTPIANVTVTLSGPVVPIPPPVLTSAAGTFSFPNLPSGIYTVAFTTPAGHTLVSGAPCTVNLVAPAAAVCPADAVYNNGANVITGIARLDTNNNGNNDATDKAHAGVTVTATVGATVLTATTAADGTFQFPGLGNATYTVAPGAQPGFIVSPASVTRVVDGVTPPAAVPVLLQSCAIGVDVSVARGNGANSNKPANNERISMSATLRPGCPAIPAGAVTFRFLPAAANYPGGPPANFTVTASLSAGVYTSATLNSAAAVWTPGDTRVEVLVNGTTKIGELVVVVT